ncbi:MAG: hypothetical protein AAF990_08030 [Bacteroidota bacterium]
MAKSISLSFDATKLYEVDDQGAVRSYLTTSPGINLEVVNDNLVVTSAGSVPVGVEDSPVVGPFQIGYDQSSKKLYIIGEVDNIEYREVELEPGVVVNVHLNAAGEMEVRILQLV